MDKNTKDILDALDFIKERLVTKDDVRDIIKEEVPPSGGYKLRPSAGA
jgi:hypothetical protein